MTVLKDLAVETIFALFLDHFLYYCVFVVIILFLWYFLVFYAPCKRNYIFNLHWNSCSHFYKSCKMTGSVLLSWSGWWILSHQHTYYMGCWWCHEPNESDSCGLNGGNMLCSMCFLWSAFRFFIFISFFFWLLLPPFWAILQFIWFSVDLFLMYCMQKTVFAGQPTKPDYNHIPCAVFRYLLLDFLGLFIFFHNIIFVLC
jgi:hypothetical protein